MCARFVLSLVAFWLFTVAGWIVMPATGLAFVWDVVIISLIVFLFDILLFGVDILLQVLSIPASCMTLGIFPTVIKGVLKYFALLGAASVTHLFIMPWIFGPFWYMALIIGVVFAVIGRVGASAKVKYTSSYRSRRS